MSSILLTGPAVEPLTLAEAKEYLRVDTGDDDDVITALIAGARVHVEAQTRRALITQSWRLVRDGWPPDGRLPVLPAPLRSVDAARYYDEDERDASRSTPAASWSTAGVVAARLRVLVDAGAGPRCRRHRDRCHGRLWRCVVGHSRSRCARRSGCSSRTGTRTAA